LIRLALWGAGTAGRARARSLEGHPDGALVAVWRGRYASSLGVPVMDDALSTLGDVDAVIVASPSEAHEEQVETALAHHKHVLVDYPLARTAEGARRCFASAARARRVLHVGHIELVSAATERMRLRASPQDITSSHLDFSAPGEPWPDGAAHAWHSLARVTRSLAVCGAVVGVDVERSDGAELRATLFHEQGAVTTLDLRRGGDAPRRQRWELRAQGEAWSEEPAEGAPPAPREGSSVVGQVGSRGLFARDTDSALARIVHGLPPVWPEALEIHALNVVACLGSPGSRDVAPPAS
jgi:hypothetical protein